MSFKSCNSYFYYIPGTIFFTLLFLCWCFASIVSKLLLMKYFEIRKRDRKRVKQQLLHRDGALTNGSVLFLSADSVFFMIVYWRNVSKDHCIYIHVIVVFTLALHFCVTDSTVPILIRVYPAYLIKSLALHNDLQREREREISHYPTCPRLHDSRL